MADLNLDNLNNQTSKESPTQKEDAGSDFLAEEKKFLHPQTANDKFNKWLDWARKVPQEEKIFFTQNLGVMLKSGLPASRALQTLGMQTSNPKFKRVLFKIFRNVEKGEGLAKSMEPFPKVFDAIFVNMIRAGESSGQMEDVLVELTRQSKRSHELKQKVKGALMYPIAILIAMIGIGSAMIIFVIPKLLSIFEELNAELPLPTRILIAISNGINDHIILYSIIIILVTASLLYFIRTPKGKKIWHKLILKMPVVKKISRKINLAQTSRTLGSMLKTDMPIVQSMKLSGDVLKNVHYKNSMYEMSESIEKGKTISSQMANYPHLYPPIIQQMLAVGEETGEMSKVLIQLAEFYEEDVSQTMDSLPSLIEPILIVVMGAAVGGMAVSIILPMFTLSQAV